MITLLDFTQLALVTYFLFTSIGSFARAFVVLITRKDDDDNEICKTPTSVLTSSSINIAILLVLTMLVHITAMSMFIELLLIMIVLVVTVGTYDKLTKIDYPEVIRHAAYCARKSEWASLDFLQFVLFFAISLMLIVYFWF